MVPNQLADGVKGMWAGTGTVVGAVQNEMRGGRLDPGKTEYDEAHSGYE
jgi:hypothetical protein